MAVASSQTHEFTVDRLVAQAYRLAGLMAIEEEPEGVQWEKRASFGRQMLEMLVKRLETEARLVRARRLIEVQLVENQSDYTLPENVMDVYGDGAYTEPSAIPTAARFETPVRQISQEEWQRLGTRNTSGRPTLYFAQRAQAPLKVILWPAPDSASLGVIRFQVYEFLANMTDGAANPDLERYWALYLTYALGTVLAESSSMPSDKVMRLRAESEQLMVKCKMYSRQRVDNQAMVVHRYGRR